jgi:hypothetical protein
MGRDILLLQLINQPTQALDKIKFMTSVNMPHVSALECHPQGVFQIKGIQGLYDNLGMLRQRDVSVEITRIYRIL